MRLLSVIVAIQIIEVHSAPKISLPNDHGPLIVAAGSIIDKCFGVPERWSELLVISEQDSHRILEKIHRESKTSNSILSLDRPATDQLAHHKEYGNYSNTSVQWQASKPAAVVISANGSEELQSILSSLKNHIQRIWRPRSYFLIVLESGCNATEANDMFKAVWNYWILNAMIVCLSNNSTRRNQSEIELFTFNPYSAEHSSQWEIIINETVEVSITPGNFNHSWYVFKQGFDGIGSFRNCDDTYFDKTSDLDGYVIPISILDPIFLVHTASEVSHHYKVDRCILRTVATRLRFHVVQVPNDDPHRYGTAFKKGSFIGLLEDIRYERSHFLPSIRNINSIPGLGFTYPHSMVTACFASRISGFRSQWANITFAKHIWIGLGLCIICFTFVLYLQSKSYGIMSAFLDAERLITGSSITHLSKAIKHRIILGSIFLVLLVVDGCIRGRFISILTLARPLPNIDTIEQLKEQDLKLYGHSGYRDGMIDSELQKRYNVNVSFTTCIAALERGEQQRACFTSCEILPFQTMNSSIIHGSSISVWSSYVAFATTKHWPMTNRYSLEVQKLVASGINEKWRLDLTREFEVNAWKQKRAAVPPYVKPSKLSDLLPAFVVLFVGLSAASIALAWEMKSWKSFRCVKS